MEPQTGVGLNDLNDLNDLNEWLAAIGTPMKQQLPFLVNSGVLAMWACVQLPAAGGGKGSRGWPPTCLERRSWGSRNRDAWGRRCKRTLFVLCGKHALVGIQVMRLLNVVGRGR